MPELVRIFKIFKQISRSALFALVFLLPFFDTYADDTCKNKTISDIYVFPSRQTLNIDSEDNAIQSSGVEHISASDDVCDDSSIIKTQGFSSGSGLKCYLGSPGARVDKGYPFTNYYDFYNDAYVFYIGEDVNGEMIVFDYTGAQQSSITDALSAYISDTNNKDYVDFCLDFAQKYSDDKLYSCPGIETYRLFCLPAGRYFAHLPNM